MNQYVYVNGGNMKRVCGLANSKFVGCCGNPAKFLFSSTGPSLFTAFQLFGSSKRASIRKTLLASLKRGLLRRIPKTNLKRILQRMMEAMVKTVRDSGPSIPS